MKYGEKFKLKLVDEYYNGRSATDICFENQLPRSTFYTWLKPYQTETTKSGYKVNTNEFIKLNQKLEKQYQIIEVLRTVNCTMSASLKDKLYELEKLHGQYSVHVLCEALDVARGTYYNHVFRNKKDNNSYQSRRDELSKQIKKVFDESNQIFGANKIKVILSERGINVSVKMVSELMKEMNISSIRTNSKKIYEKQRIKDKKQDILNMNFSVSAPNQVWTSDVTEFKIKGKRYYICVIIDLYARKVIAYKISLRQSTQLVTSTFKNAYSKRNPEKGLIFHSDRGAPYISNKFRLLLKKMNVEQSFSPKSKPTHNAVAEAFFANFKQEELYRRNYSSEREFREYVQEYMELYNVKRPHSTLSNKTPSSYESTYFKLVEQNKH